jgi:hypothetical protein
MTDDERERLAKGARDAFRTDDRQFGAGAAARADWRSVRSA